VIPTEEAVLEWMPDGVVVCDRAGTIVFVNRQAEEMTGYSRGELVGRRIETLVPIRYRRRHPDLRAGFHRRGKSRPMGGNTDLLLRRKDGSLLAVDIALGPMDKHTVVAIRDVTERRSMEEALTHRALHDPLTELANRSLFFDRLRQALGDARRTRSTVAVVMLDLDGFKAVNDAFGHAIGDEVLRTLGGRLGEGLRATDTAARIGGDEFSLVMPHVASRRAVQAAVRKRLRAVERPVVVGRRKISVGISAGISLYPDDARDADSLIRHADGAMYSAKREGRDVVFHLSPR
jgi:diguanylate cyclase (GGDEF)-like protein/PAS domain S-box-containing protein